jgi:predicted ArsR family transcriptional regulator
MGKRYHAGLSPGRLCETVVMDVPPITSGELSQPTRARLFALLSEVHGSASTDDLAEALELHPNGVRVHLERLRAAGLVVRERQRQPRGRPRDRWSISPTALPGGEPPTAYVDVGRWLVRAISSTKVELRDIEAAGRGIGRDLAPRDGAETAEARMHGALVALGFQPTRELDEPGKMTYCLGNCPYRDVVRERQPVVCALHRGITQGMLDTLDPKTKLVGFVPKDPDEAGCLIELRGPMARDAAEQAGAPAP